MTPNIPTLKPRIGALDTRQGLPGFLHLCRVGSTIITKTIDVRIKGNSLTEIDCVIN